MKNIIWVVLFVISFVSAEDKLEEFFNHQIQTELKLLDNNLSATIKTQIKKEQKKDYKKFFFNFASHYDEYIGTTNPYLKEINKLKLRIRHNKYKHNTDAVKRDELSLRIYELKLSLREILNSLVKDAKRRSKTYFQYKVSDKLAEFFDKYEPIDKKQFKPTNPDRKNKITKAIDKNLLEVVATEHMINTFSSELIDNATNIYHTIKLSSSKLFALIDYINQLPVSKSINSYLSYIQLDIAKILLILSLILIIMLIHSITNFAIDKLLKHYKLNDDDIEYVHTHINRTINILTSLIISHVILVVYFGFDIKSFDITKAFFILYVILFGTIIYRVTNLVASIKIEHIQTSRVLRKEVINLGIKVSNSVIVLLCALLILKILGVDLTALLSGLGIGGFALAFAAKDSIANIFGSISILASDMFEQGDWIEVGDIEGTVVEIGLRGTTIRTFDNALISIPNFKLANEGVKNWSRRSIGRRIKMLIGVTYESNFDDIKKAIEDIREMLKKHPDIANEHTKFQNPYRQAKLVSKEDFKGVKRTTMVYLDNFGDSSINILIYCFSRSVEWAEWLRVKEDVMYKIANILNQNNLEFAYPTMTIHKYEESRQ